MRSLSLVALPICLFVIISLHAVTMADARPLVEVDKKGEDRSVGVNIPFIYAMDLLTGKRGTKTALNVLSGLVQVDVDTRNQKAKGHRPVRVSLFGNRLYDSFPQDESAEMAASEDKPTDVEENTPVVESVPKKKRNNSV